MSLATVAARRLLLRRGAGALAALFVTGSGKGGYNHPASTPSAPNYAPPQSASTNDDSLWEARNSAARPLHEKQNRIATMEYMRYRAWNEQDADLRVLLSTSPAWRASVMHDRLMAKQSIADRFEQEIRAIWESPFEKLKEAAAKMIGAGL